MVGKKLFGTNGIRGVVNNDLTPEFVMKIARAIGTYFSGGKILVGHDSRTSSPMFSQVVIGGLISTGCTTYDVGMAPTPTIQYAVKYHKMDGGVIITASHNPPNYNGVKVIAEDGIEVPREREIEIESIFFQEKIKKARWDEIGAINRLPGIRDIYIRAIKKNVAVNAIQQKGFHVVVDPGNGVGGLTAPYLIRELGCRITTINANIDGAFPSRPPEPTPENLGGLSATVLAVDADLGVAYDGDGDRSIFIDEKGKPHWGDQTFALIEKYFLQNNPGETVVTPISSSYAIKEIANKYGGRVIWTKVGSIIVSHEMRKLKAKLGGEENGGVFFAPHQPVRDGGMATAIILEIMAKTGKKLSKLLKELPFYYIEKDKIHCPNELKERVLEQFISRIKKRLTGLSINTIDGVKIWFSDKSSILIRPSGTEPIYRFYAEGKTRNRVVQLINEYKGKVNEIVDGFESYL